MYKKLYGHPELELYLYGDDDVIVMSGFDGFNSDDKDNLTDREINIL